MKPSKEAEPGTQAGSELKAVQTAALRLLARREHSCEELRRKLLAKGHPAGVVSSVISVLGAKRLVSDDRFVANYIHHHAMRGRGPIRIRAELRQHGVSEGVIEEKMDDAEADWSRLAAQVRARKFGSKRPAALTERAKQARFLQYRGFTSEQIRAAFRSSDSGEEEDVHGFDPDFDS